MVIAVVQSTNTTEMDPQPPKTEDLSPDSQFKIHGRECTSPRFIQVPVTHSPVRECQDPRSWDLQVPTAKLHWVHPQTSENTRLKTSKAEEFTPKKSEKELHTHNPQDRHFYSSYKTVQEKKTQARERWYSSHFEESQDWYSKLHPTQSVTATLPQPKEDEISTS